MSGILVSPSLDQKVRRRNSQYKRRNDSGDFRDILKARFVSRLKARRGALLDQFRGNAVIDDELHSKLRAVAHEDVHQLKLNKDFELMELDYEEKTNEEENWLVKEYEKILEDEEIMINEALENQVICPLCERSVLKFNLNQGSCSKCSSQFPPVPSLKAMQESLNSCTKAHDTNCNAISEFVLICDLYTNGLFLICQTCGFFIQAL